LVQKKDGSKPKDKKKNPVKKESERVGDKTKQRKNRLNPRKNSPKLAAWCFGVPTNGGEVGFLGFAGLVSDWKKKDGNPPTRKGGLPPGPHPVFGGTPKALKNKMGKKKTKHRPPLSNKHFVPVAQDPRQKNGWLF